MLCSGADEVDSGKPSDVIRQMNEAAEQLGMIQVRSRMSVRSRGRRSALTSRDWTFRSAP